MKNTNFKKAGIVFLILVVLVAIISQVFMSDELEKKTIQSVTFIKTGEVRTLINDGERYFVKTENFNYDGTYQTPATEKQITYQEYSQMKATKDYDIYADINQQRVNGVYIDVSVYQSRDGQYLRGSYMGRIIDGDFGDIETKSKTQTILLNDSGELFYVITKYVDENGDYTKPATYNMVDIIKYTNVKDSEKYDYEIEYEYKFDDKAYKITSFFDVKGDPIIRPIISNIFGVYTIEDLMDELRKEDPTIPEVTPTPPVTPTPTPKPDDKDEGNGGNNGNGGTGNSGGIDGGKAPWNGSTFTWSDGYSSGNGNGTSDWADSWMDATGSSDWYDSFNGMNGDGSVSDNYVPGQNDFGYIDDNGQFIATDENMNVIATEDGTFDENGNFTPEGGDSYFDPNGVEHPADTVPPVEKDEDGNIITEDGKINEDGQVVPNEPVDPAGVTTPEGGFNQPNNTNIDKNGNVSETGEIPQAGSKFLAKSGSLLLNEYNEIYIKGHSKDIYDETGLVTLSNGNKGYYDENGKLIESVTNQNSIKGGFYDVNKTWHTFTEIYKDSSGDLSLTLYPAIGLEVVDNKFSIAGQQYQFDRDGLTLNGSKTGYFNSTGTFIESKKNPYSGGFFDSMGDWIDDDLYTYHGKLLSVTSAWFDPHGTFTTPSGDRGHFNKSGEFVLGEKNVKTDEGYYDIDAKLIAWGVKYTDSIGYIHETGKNGYFNEKGEWIDAKVVDGVEDSKKNLHNMFNSMFTTTGTIGHYQKENIIKGFSVYTDGFFDDLGNFLDTTGTIPNGEKSQHYTNKGIVNGPNLLADGFYNSKGNFMRYNNTIITNDNKLIIEDGTVIEGTVDANGNIVLPDGTVITPDGTIGYYDENGEFQKGDLALPDGAYIDANGNIVLPDGTVITPDGKIGYYDENGNFVEGENPNADGYYDAEGNFHPYGEEYYIDENGNKVYPDGTVITPDGKVGYYDENGNFVEGVNPNAIIDANGNIILADGTVITPDGKIGYYDENGNFIEGENPNADGFYDAEGNFHAYGEDLGIIDKNGNTVMANGTVITPDGKVGVYDENGNFVEGAVIDANGNTILPDGTVITPDGKIGAYDENGNFVEGLAPNGVVDANGNTILPDGTVITPDGKIGYYDENGVFHEGENPNPDGYYDAEGNFHPYGEEYYIDENGNKVYPDGTVITPDGKVGYYDENGNFVEGINPSGVIDANGNLVLSDGTIITPDGKIGYYDENGVFHEGENPYEGGYYDADGNWIETASTDIIGNLENGKPENGYYDEDGNFVTVPIEPVPENPMHYDENGNLVAGENPYEGGYYDAQGNWHPDGENIYIDSEGNVHETAEGTIGYYDAEGNFHPADGKGYYDENGNYHSEDGKVGYFDKDGVFHEGANPYEGGYYDADGNWHPTGDEGYYDKNGVYHENVVEENLKHYDKEGNLVDGANPYTNGAYDENGNFVVNDGSGKVIDENGNVVYPDGTVITPDGKVGYYDKNGNFVEGINPNAKKDASGNIVLSDGTVITPDGKIGHYDENGNFVEDGKSRLFDANGNAIDEARSKYYDENGNLIEGQNPYEGGYYDAQGNWHPEGANGYFDENGTFHSEDGTIGYYDANGIFHEGTNPYAGGYYDADGNWHPEGDSGYFDKYGNYHGADGKVGYFDENGVFHLGENPFEGGYYDAEGNWHPFGKDGYYDAEGNWISYLNVVDKYNATSNSYILYEGYFRDPTMRNRFRQEGNTIQFTTNKSAINPRYTDTGFYVSQNAILEYDEAQDVLHNIAISTGNVFVKDSKACMLVYNGKVVSLAAKDFVTITDLKELFVDTNISIAVKKSRVGGKFAFVEAVESNQNISISVDGKVRALANQLIVRNNQVYIALDELSDLNKFDVKIKDFKNEKEVTMTRKKDTPMAITTDISFATNGGFINVIGSIGEGNFEMVNSPVTFENKVYIPVNMLPQIIEKDLTWDSYTFTLKISDNKI